MKPPPHETCPPCVVHGGWQYVAFVAKSLVPENKDHVKIGMYSSEETIVPPSDGPLTRSHVLLCNQLPFAL